MKKYIITLGPDDCYDLMHGDDLIFTFTDEEGQDETQVRVKLESDTNE